MWVRTPRNDLCNLSHARRGTLEKDVIPGVRRVRAFANSGSAST